MNSEIWVESQKIEGASGESMESYCGFSFMVCHIQSPAKNSAVSIYSHRSIYGSGEYMRARSTISFISRTLDSTDLKGKEKNGALFKITRKHSRKKPRNWFFVDFTFPWKIRPQRTPWVSVKLLIGVYNKFEVSDIRKCYRRLFVASDRMFECFMLHTHKLHNYQHKYISGLDRAPSISLPTLNIKISFFVSWSTACSPILNMLKDFVYPVIIDEIQQIQKLIFTINFLLTFYASVVKTECTGY